jgi:hypothetical protein
MVLKEGVPQHRCLRRSRGINLVECRAPQIRGNNSFSVWQKVEKDPKKPAPPPLISSLPLINFALFLILSDVA